MADSPGIFFLFVFAENTSICSDLLDYRNSLFFQVDVYQITENHRLVVGLQ